MIGLLEPEEFSFGQYFCDVVKIFLKMELSMNLLGAMWFLRTLFIVAITVDVLLFLFGDRNSIILTLLLASAAITALFRTLPPDAPVVRQLVLVTIGAFFFLSFRNRIQADRKYFNKPFQMYICHCLNYYPISICILSSS